MFIYFKPIVIEEVCNTKSKVSISFNGWGLKHKKLSVVGVVVHFINNKYKAVLRLIGLPKLLGHRKSGVGKLFFYYFKCSCNTLIIVLIYASI
jgi:hypothetical protein